MATADELRRLAQQRQQGGEQEEQGGTAARLRQLAEQRAQGSQQEEQRDTSRSKTQNNLPAFQDTKSFGDYLTTLGSLAGNTAVGALTSIEASGKALGVGIYEYIRGDEDPVLAAIQAGEEVQEKGFLTGGEYLDGVPEDETARGVFEGIGKPLQELEKGANIVGNKIRDTTGSTALGSAAATAITLAPDLIGLRGTTARLGARRTAKQKAKDVKNAGVTPGAPTDQKVEQIGAAGQRQTAGTSRSGSTDSVVEAVRAERKRLKEAEDAAWDELRATDAYVSINDLAPMQSSVQKSLREAEFDLQDPSFRQVRQRVQELEDLTLPGDMGEDAVRIGDLVKYRKRLNANEPSEKPAKLANQMIKARVDEYLLNDFSTVAIAGDQAARKNWQKAISSSKELKGLFDSKDGKYRVLRELSRKEATPEEYRRMIFGANAIQGNTQAGQYISAIKEVIGEQSPQFKALRADASLDIMDPILKDSVQLKDVQKFVSNYDMNLKKSPTLAKELFGNEGAKEMRDLVDIARATVNTKDMSKFLSLDVPRTTARVTFGNQLARNASIIQIAANGFKLLGRLRNKSKKRAFLGEMLGYDPSVPMIPVKQLATIEGLRSTANRTAEQEQEEE